MFRGLFRGIRNSEFIDYRRIEQASEVFLALVLLKCPDIDETIFNVILDEFIGCRQLERAIDIFRKVRLYKSEGKSIIAPDTISFNTIFKGCA